MKVAKKLLFAVLSVCISMAALLALFMAGIKLETNNKTLWISLSVLTVVVLVGMAVFNILRTRALNKKAADMNAQQLHDFLLSYKEKMETNAEAERKKFKKTVFTGYLWVSVIFVLLLAGMFFLGASVTVRKEGSELMTLLATAYLLLAMCALLGILSLFIGTDSYIPEKKYLLKEEDCPVLYSVTRRAADCAGVKKNFALYITGDGFSIGEERGVISVYIDTEELSFLTEEEFYSIMLHEFAHIKNFDTKESTKYGKICSRWSGEADSYLNSVCAVPRTIFFEYFTARINLEYTLYKELSSRQRETEADAFVKSAGMGKVYVNATAKACMYAFCREDSDRELSFDIYESETPVSDYASRSVAVFERKIAEKREDWDFYLRHELPARIDTHPTFRMRMEAMGETDYDISARETEGAFAEDKKKALQIVDKQCRENIKPNYMYIRSDYLKKKKQIAEYERAKEAGETENYSLLKLTEAAYLFYGIDDEECLSLAERILEKNPSSAYGAFFKGAYLADRRDDACIDFLYKAVKVPTLAEEAADKIGKFALKNGRQDLIDAYRARSAEFMQAQMDVQMQTQVTKRDKLSAFDVPAEDREKVIEAIAGESEGKVSKIYACIKQPRKEGDKEAFIYTVELRNSLPPEDIDEELGRIGRVLEYCGLPEKYLFFGLYCANYAPAIVSFIKKQVPDCLIYEREEKNS